MRSVADLFDGQLYQTLSRVLGANLTLALMLVATLAIPIRVLRDRHRMRRMKRGFCDDAIRYAQKKRLAFGKPSLTASELAAVRTFAAAMTL